MKRVLSIFFLCSVFITCGGGLVLGQDEPEGRHLPDQGEQVPEGPSWEELRPDATDSDWIQLDTKEWLRGDLRTIYKDRLEFDSEHLGLLVIDMDDVEQIITRDQKAVFIAGRGTYYGKVDLKGDKLLLVGATGQQNEFSRRDLVSMAAGSRKGRQIWDGYLSAGVNLSEGNTKRTEYNMKFSARRRTSQTRYKLDYTGIYSRSEGDTDSNNHRVTTSYDIYKTRHFFWRPLIGDLYIDTLQNIAYRILLGFGLGYDIIDTGKTTWTLFCGPAVHYTKFDTVAEDEDSAEYSPAFVFSSDFETELTSFTDLEVNYQGSVVNEKAGTYLHRLSASLKNELVEDFDLDLTFIWDYIDNPQEDTDDEMPKKSDYKFLVGIGYHY